ncbi:hypothetical protein D4764_11G0010190 [Takifugu flavidus]|uniref:Uncharacterized protein n=1 Tax=Takifugu flavidus TaxID=433684 RepID=A0A5C6PJK8_9TELE|nr:hypothetical protein D4764_11G0010190 [Takifugu flavidus]
MEQLLMKHSRLLFLPASRRLVASAAAAAVIGGLGAYERVSAADLKDNTKPSHESFMGGFAPPPPPIMISWRKESSHGQVATAQQQLSATVFVFVKKM